LLKKFFDQINGGLRHSNPQVRKEAEKLFQTLYKSYGAKLESMLTDQKPTLVAKILKVAKQELLQTASSGAKQFTSANPSKMVENDETRKEQNV
jgi:hypothetical protein